MSHFLKVVTYNLANYDDWAEWDTRRQMLAQVLIEADADVILLQVLPRLLLFSSLFFDYYLN